MGLAGLLQQTLEPPEETAQEREEREYRERRSQRRLRLKQIRRKMKFIETESQMDKYAFYFEGQSYTIRSPQAIVVDTGGKTPQGHRSKHCHLSTSDNNNNMMTATTDHLLRN